MATLMWICQGAFRLRGQQIEAVANRAHDVDGTTRYHPHPHPQYNFLDVPRSEPGHPVDGLRFRTVMVSNVPPSLRIEAELKKYFEHFMSRPLDKPSVGLTSSMQPGFFNKSFAFLFNRAKRIPMHISNAPPATGDMSNDVRSEPANDYSENIPVIDRVVVARKMTNLASLLERREEVLRRLETAHLNLAQKVLTAVVHDMEGRPTPKKLGPKPSKKWSYLTRKKKKLNPVSDVEHGESHTSTEDEAVMKALTDALAPFVDEFNLRQPMASRSRKALEKSKYTFRKFLLHESNDENLTDTELAPAISPPTDVSVSETPHSQRITIWEALLRLDRSLLDHFQPLVNLSHLFRDQTVPAIDYYTAKLGLLTSFITENRAKAVGDYDAVSTAFVTFADPLDARRACKYLAVHPDNPLTCLVTMAPGYHDIDWMRVMKSNYRVEVKFV